MGKPCQFHYRVFSPAFPSCLQWLQTVGHWAPGRMRMVRIRCQVQRLCHVSKAYWLGPLMTQAPQLEVSKATHTAPSGAQLITLSTLSLSSPYLSIGTRPWLPATPMPVKDSLTAKDRRSTAGHFKFCLCGCWIGSSPKGFPSSFLLGPPDWGYSWVPLGLDPFPGALVLFFRTLRDLSPFVRAFLQQMGWFPHKSWALYSQAPWSILLEPATLKPNSNAGWNNTTVCEWINRP